MVSTNLESWVTYDSTNDKDNEADDRDNHEYDDTEAEVAGRCNVFLLRVRRVVSGNDPRETESKENVHRV